MEKCHMPYELSWDLSQHQKRTCFHGVPLDWEPYEGMAGSVGFFHSCVLRAPNSDWHEIHIYRIKAF